VWLGSLIAASIEARRSLERLARWRAETSVAAAVVYAKGA